MVALEMSSQLAKQLAHSNVRCSSISVILISGILVYTVKTGHAFIYWSAITNFKILRELGRGENDVKDSLV